MTERLSIIRRFKVQSCSDGSFRVTARYKRGFTKPGVITRLHCANVIQESLNKRVAAK